MLLEHVFRQKSLNRNAKMIYKSIGGAIEYRMFYIIIKSPDFKNDTQTNQSIGGAIEYRMVYIIIKSLELNVRDYLES